MDKRLEFYRKHLLEVYGMKKKFIIFSLIVLFVVLEFSQLVELPRETTLITTGPRASSPGNFNVFVTTWRDPNRGIQQLMLEPLWTMEPARGEVINSLAAAQQWRNFGIDVNVMATEAHSDLISVGDFVVSDDWPVLEPWGGHADLHRMFNDIHSKYYRPKGERAAVGQGPFLGRWTD